MMTPFGYPLALYHCLLDEQPHYLVPSRLLEDLEIDTALIVNPNCWFSWDGPLPVDKAMRVAYTEEFCPSDFVVWVDSPASGAVWPYWVGEEFYSYLSGMAPGYPAPIDLPEHVAWVLRSANILVAPEAENHERRTWSQMMHEKSILYQRGYVAVSGLVPTPHLAALRRYYRYHTRVGSFTFGDIQVSRRYIAHNETVARFYHHQLAGAMGDIAAAALKPSYSYFAACQGDAELPWHIEREQCEHSISLSIDASPEPEDHDPWPLDLQTSEGQLRVWQRIGDAIAYRGRYLPHARERLPSGFTSSSILFHYVDENHQGSLD